jgi:hypothetical protein
MSDERSGGDRVMVRRCGGHGVDVVADHLKGPSDESYVARACLDAHGADVIGEPLEIDKVSVELRDLSIDARNLVGDEMNRLGVRHGKPPTAR